MRSQNNFFMLTIFQRFNINQGRFMAVGQGILKTRSIGISTHFACFIQGNIPDLKMRMWFNFGNNSSYGLFAGLLRRIDPDLISSTIKKLPRVFITASPSTRGSGCTHFVINKKAGTNDRRIANASGMFKSHATCCAGSGHIAITVHSNQPDSIVIFPVGMRRIACTRRLPGCVIGFHLSGKQIGFH